LIKNSDQEMLGVPEARAIIRREHQDQGTIITTGYSNCARHYWQNQWVSYSESGPENKPL